MKTKKALAFLSALCMMTVIAGCESKESSTAESSKPQESSAVEESSEAETTAAPEESSEAETTAAAEPAKSEIDANAITFDSPSLYTAHAGDDSGAAKCNLDIVDFNGDKKLRVQVLDKDDKGSYNIPKIIFDLPALLGVENVGKIGHISADLDCVARGTWTNDDGSESLVVGNFLGTFGGNIASEKRKDEEGNLTQEDWNQNDFSFQDWENPTASFHFETKPALLPTKHYASDEGTSLMIMRWGQANQVDFYIDNLTFYDDNGKSIPVTFDAAANAVEVKADDPVPEAPAAPTEESSKAAE